MQSRNIQKEDASPRQQGLFIKQNMTLRNGGKICATRWAWHARRCAGACARARRWAHRGNNDAALMRLGNQPLALKKTCSVPVARARRGGCSEEDGEGTR